MLGIGEEDTHFDTDIIVGINSVFMTLKQLGVGSTGFSISDKTKTWTDYSSDTEIIEGVKLYMYLKVRLAFDPPSNSFVLESIDRQIKEAEWRLNEQFDKPVVDPVV